MWSVPMFCGRADRCTLPACFWIRTPCAVPIHATSGAGIVMCLLASRHPWCSQARPMPRLPSMQSTREIEDGAQSSVHTALRTYGSQLQDSIRLFDKRKVRVMFFSFVCGDATRFSISKNSGTAAQAGRGLSTLSACAHAVLKAGHGRFRVGLDIIYLPPLLRIFADELSSSEAQRRTFDFCFPCGVATARVYLLCLDYKYRINNTNRAVTQLYATAVLNIHPHDYVVQRILLLLFRALGRPSLNDTCV